MKQYSVTSDLGHFFVITSNLMGVGIVGFLLYSVLTLNWVATTLCLVIAIMHFLKFFRNTIRFKEVHFDERYLYFDEKMIPIHKIIRVYEKKIVYDEMRREETLYFNYFFCENIKLLKELHAHTLLHQK